MAIISTTAATPTSTSSTSASSVMSALDTTTSYLVGVTVLADAIVDGLVAVID